MNTGMLPLPEKPIPKFNVGDTVSVVIKSFDGATVRLQSFQGIVIRRKGKGFDETFAVRKVSFGVGVERIFPLYSPNIEKIEVISRGYVRRAKLYYIRSGKPPRIKKR